MTQSPSVCDWAAATPARAFGQATRQERGERRTGKGTSTSGTEAEEGDEIRWAWSASGQKLRREVLHAGGGSVRRDYAAGGFVYEAAGGTPAALKYFSTSEGRAVAEPGGSGWEYEYHLTDHLGNTRVAFVADGSGGANVVQRAAYYPYGLRWYHYGARFYDPQIGKWTRMDPADEFHSPYTYVGNDPVNRVDPDGRQSTSFDIYQDIRNRRRAEQAPYNSPGRPDADGKLTLAEANWWYRQGKGEKLKVSLSQMDLSMIDRKDFPDGPGSTEYINLLFEGNAEDGLVYGSIGFTLQEDGTVTALSDVYDFDMHDWDSPKSAARNIETVIGETVAGEGEPFQIEFEGNPVIGQQSQQERE